MEGGNKSLHGNTYNNCKVINIETPSPYKKQLMEWFENESSDSPPPNKEVPETEKKSSYSDPEVDEVIKTINIEKIEKDFYEKKTMTTQTRRARVRNPYARNN